MEDGRYLFHVLHGGGKQALLLDFGKPSHTAVSLSVQLFGFRKAALDGLFSAFVDLSSDIRMCELIRFILEFLPYMTSQALGLLLCCKALFPSWTVRTSAVFALVFLVAVPVCRHVFEVVPFGTYVYVPFLQVNEFKFPVLPLLLTASSISHRGVYSHIVKVFAYR